jgi:hypothetical protein
MKSTLIKSLALLAVLALGAGIASAGCGAKDTHEGTLNAVNADSKTIVVVVDGEEVKLNLTDETRVMDAEGNETKAASLVGKKIKVVSEHAKIDSIEQLA